MPDNKECPHCGTSLQGPEIPLRNSMTLKPVLYVGAAHFKRELGIEDPEVCDGILFWKCPDCKGNWHRWDKGTWQRDAANRRYGVEK
jgi:rubredoxin